MCGAINAINYLVAQGLMEQYQVYHMEKSPEHIIISVNHHHYVFNVAGVLVAVE